MVILCGHGGQEKKYVIVFKLEQGRLRLSRGWSRLLPDIPSRSILSVILKAIYFKVTTHFKYCGIKSKIDFKCFLLIQLVLSNSLFSIKLETAAMLKVILVFLAVHNSTFNQISGFALSGVLFRIQRDSCTQLGTK